MMVEIHYINAQGKILGRLASEVARLLQGKHLPSWRKHQAPSQQVVVYGVKKIRVTGRKLTSKIYWRSTSRPGSLRGTRLADLLARRPEEVFRRAVWGMLPRNKLRKVMMRQLKIFAGELPAKLKQGDERGRK
jgi:large subunit ribosomal protein L13